MSDGAPRNPFWLLIVGCGVLFGIGLLPMPYGFYTLSRLGVCAVCVYVAVRANGLGRVGWAWVLGATAVVYNPLVPLRLGSKPMWTMVNATTLLLLVIAGVALILPRFRGQLDYAARTATRALNSYSMGFR